MEVIETIPDKPNQRLNTVIEKAWKIFINQFLNEKYYIELEAPFQLHFAGILKLVGELYCIKRREIFFVDLESKVTIAGKNKYIDIICGFILEDKEYKTAIELKFKTKSQSAEDLGAMEIYKDIYYLENLLQDNNSFQSAYFLMITDNDRYIKIPRKNSLRDTFNTSDAYKIEIDREYKHTKTKTGEDFYNKNGSFKFKREYKFEWSADAKKSYYFLKLKI